MSKLLSNSYVWIYCFLTIFFLWYSHGDGLDINFTLWIFWVCSIICPVAMQIRGNSWPNEDRHVSGENPVTHIYDLFRGRKLDEQSLITVWVVLGYFISASVALIVVNITG